MAERARYPNPDEMLKPLDWTDVRDALRWATSIIESPNWPEEAYVWQILKAYIIYKEQVDAWQKLDDHKARIITKAAREFNKALKTIDTSHKKLLRDNGIELKPLEILYTK